MAKCAVPRWGLSGGRNWSLPVDGHRRQVQAPSPSERGWGVREVQALNRPRATLTLTLSRRERGSQASLAGASAAELGADALDGKACGWKPPYIPLSAAGRERESIWEESYSTSNN